MTAVNDRPQLTNKKNQYSFFKLIILHKKISKYLDQFYLIIYIQIVGVHIYFGKLSLSQRKDYFQNRFYGRPKWLLFPVSVFSLSRLH